MKRLKWLFGMVSVSVLFACVGLFSACDSFLARHDDPTYYTVTIAPYDTEGGTVTVSSSASDKGYVKDEEVTLTVTPAANYAVDEVKVNDAAVELTEGKYTFKVAGNTTVSATFEDTRTYYTVTIAPYDTESGTVKVTDPASSKGYVAEEQVTLTVTPDADHEVKEVKVNDAPVALDAQGSYTFQVAGNTTVSATFAEVQKYFTVMVAPYNTAQGTVQVSPSEEADGYTKEEQVTLTVTANAKYTVGSVEVNNAPVALDAQGKYTFSVTGDVTVSVKFVFEGLRTMTWMDSGYSNIDGLGTLTFDENYNMKLTPSGGVAQDVTITTAGVDLSKGLPEGEIDVRVGTGSNMKTYKVSFGAGITFKEGYTEHVFDSPAITDFSDYAGTWKQYSSDPTRAASITVTAASLVYTYFGGNHDTYQAYYTAPDGSHYLKYQRSAISKPQRYSFGYLDNAKKVIYFEMTDVQYFTADGALPVAAFPAEFYGEWLNETYYGLSISAAGVLIDTAEVNVFAVSGAGRGAVVHAFSNGLYCKFFMQKNPTTSEMEIVLSNGATNNVFTAVKPEALPAEYRGEWTGLVGNGTFSVDSTGKIVYGNRVYEVTRDSHDFGFHFTTEAGKRATVMYFANGGVLAFDDGDGHISYYAKTPLGSLNDLAASGVPAGTWTAGSMTLTVSADKKITIAEGAGEAKAVRLVFAESIIMDEVRHYNGEAIYDGVYWEFDYDTETKTITLTKNNDFARRTTESITFTQPQ